MLKLFTKPAQECKGGHKILHKNAYDRRRIFLLVFLLAILVIPDFLIAQVWIFKAEKKGETFVKSSEVLCFKTCFSTPTVEEAEPLPGGVWNQCFRSLDGQDKVLHWKQTGPIQRKDADYYVADLRSQQKRFVILHNSALMLLAAYALLTILSFLLFFSSRLTEYLLFSIWLISGIGLAIPQIFNSNVLFDGNEFATIVAAFSSNVFPQLAMILNFSLFIRLLSLEKSRWVPLFRSLQLLLLCEIVVAAYVFYGSQSDQQLLIFLQIANSSTSLLLIFFIYVLCYEFVKNRKLITIYLLPAYIYVLCWVELSTSKVWESPTPALLRRWGF